MPGESIQLPVSVPCYLIIFSIRCLCSLAKAPSAVVFFQAKKGIIVYLSSIASPHLPQAQWCAHHLASAHWSLEGGTNQLQQFHLWICLWVHAGCVSSACGRTYIILAHILCVLPQVSTLCRSCGVWHTLKELHSYGPQISQQAETVGMPKQSAAFALRTLLCRNSSAELGAGIYSIPDVYRNGLQLATPAVQCVALILWQSAGRADPFLLLLCTKQG